MSTEARGAEGQILFDGRTVTITRRGIGAFLLHGSGGTKTFPLSAITAVQTRKCGVRHGYLQLSVAGELDRGNDGGLGKSMSKDENAVVHYWAANKQMATIADEIRAAIVRHHQGGAEMPVQRADHVIFDQLEKLGRLRDAGHISESDFSSKKIELLARI